MKSELIMDFSVEKENNQITVKREFNAPLTKVWDAWTNAALRDQWWAPKPWNAETKDMNFSEGGRWLYAMVGPDGEKHWALEQYKKIMHQKNYVALSAFCDENGKINYDMPFSTWDIKFIESAGSTFVNMLLTYETQDDLEKELEMGFKEGFTMGLENLGKLLEK